MRKASRKVVEATTLRLCEGRYPTLDDLADLHSHLMVLMLLAPTHRVLSLTVFVPRRQLVSSNSHPTAGHSHQSIAARSPSGFSGFGIKASGLLLLSS